MPHRLAVSPRHCKQVRRAEALSSDSATPSGNNARSRSYHGFLKLRPAQPIPERDGHIKVAHNDGRRTRANRARTGDPCVERGTTIAYDSEAHAKSLTAVREFVTARIQPK